MNDRELLELAAKAAGLSHLLNAEIHGEEYAGYGIRSPTMVMR